MKRALFGTADCFIILIVTLVSLFTRLWRLGYPQVIIFDEVYFGNFTNSYIKHEFYTDIHPPLGKMVMAYIAYLTQYQGHINWGKGVGAKYTDTENHYVSLRLTMNIFSSFCTPLIYSALRCLGLSFTTSLSASALACFDITMIVEGKFILSDGLLHFFTCLHIFALCHFISHSSHLNALISGATLGCAVSCKFTSFGLVALDGITQLYWIVCEFPSIAKIIVRAFEFLFPLVFITFSSWAVHFIVLPYTGSDGKYSAINDGSIFDKNKENITYWGRRLLSPMLKRIIDYNLDTHLSNMRITSPHPWSSYPINWPLLLDKHVLFFSAENHINIRCIGSPVSYWASTAGLVLTIAAFPLRILDFRNFVFFIGWAFSYFPFLAVPRAMYMYHYIIPMIFASMNLATLIENTFSSYKQNGIYSQSRIGREKIAAFLNMALVIMSFLCYLFFYPWAMGVPCPECAATRYWMTRWFEGPPKQFRLIGVHAFNETKVVRDDFPI